MSNRSYTADDLARLRAQHAVSPAEAAAIVGVDRTTFYRHIMPHIRSGTVQSYKIGSRRCIIVASLLTFVEANT